MTEFGVYPLGVADGTLALSPLPWRYGDYAGDLVQVLAWRPDVVLSMTEMSEMARQGADRMGDDLVQAGVEWLHLPVEDFGVPSAGAEAQWLKVSKVIAERLADGGRVLVHCYGGCGRSGMVALRVMIAAGEAGDAALARLRVARPCAIETDAQMQWALQG